MLYVVWKLLGLFFILLVRFWISGITVGFPHSSVGKESSCNAGDPRSIPVLGRSTGEGIGYPLVFFGFPCSSAGKKKSACNVGDLGLIPGWEDPLEKGKATHSSILAWRIPWTV